MPGVKNNIATKYIRFNFVNRFGDEENISSESIYAT